MARDSKTILRAAVIGIGSMGWAHLRVYSELPTCHLVACADIDKKRLEAASKTFGCRTYTDYRKMLSAEHLDVLSIAVPTTLHARVALDVIEAGIPFLVEKPIADTLENAQSICQVAQHRGVPFMVGHIERFNPAVIKLKQLIDDGCFGDLLTVEVKRVGLYPVRVKDANIIIDVSIHDIEILNFLLGRLPDRLWINGGSAIGERIDFVEILMSYGAVSGLIQSNWITPIKIRKLYATGTKAYAELDYITQSISLYRHNLVDNNKNGNEFAKFQRISQPQEELVPVEKSEPLKLELLHLLSVAKGITKPQVTPKQAIAALNIALALDKQIKALQRRN